MRLVIAAVGRLKKGPEASLVEEYAKRIRAAGRKLGFSKFEICEVEAPRGLEGKALKAREGALLLAAAPADASLVALDEHGDSLSSFEFASMLAKWRDAGASSAVFLIGGADGHGEEVFEAAHARLAFGSATWPHMLVRAMLCEQLYRAITILSGHPYHRA
ncbi:MAG: 23S rRNA (pseudouridine(1915)-N(3))-methyltransferase RlmH [Parvularculaceae bacterium]